MGSGRSCTMKPKPEGSRAGRSQLLVMRNLVPPNAARHRQGALCFSHEAGDHPRPTDSRPDAARRKWRQGNEIRSGASRVSVWSGPGPGPESARASTPQAGLRAPRQGADGGGPTLRLVVSVAKRKIHTSRKHGSLLDLNPGGARSALVRGVESSTPDALQFLPPYAYWWSSPGITRAIAEKSRERSGCRSTSRRKRFNKAQERSSRHTHRNWAAPEPERAGGVGGSWPEEGK